MNNLSFSSALSSYKIKSSGCIFNIAHILFKDSSAIFTLMEKQVQKLLNRLTLICTITDVPKSSIKIRKQENTKPFSALPAPEVTRAERNLK